MMEKAEKSKAFVPKEECNEEDVELINKLLDRNFRIYNRLAEI